MSKQKEDPAQTALTIASAKALGKPVSRKKPINYAVLRVLKRNKFSPLSILINHTFPNLPPSKQADVLLKLCDYIYPKVKAEEITPRKRKGGPAIQVNTQVNLPPEQQQPAQQAVLAEPRQFSLKELLEAAGQPVNED